LQPHGIRSRLNVTQIGCGNRLLGRIEEHGHARDCGHQHPQELQPLRRQFGCKKIDASRIAAWPGEARDEAEPDRVFGDHEHDRN
jgi:hypothetical protein